MSDRMSVYDLLSQKGSRKWLQMHVDSGREAAAAVEAGIRILSCDPGEMLSQVRAAAPSALISAGMFHGTVASPEEAVREGFRILGDGADTVYSSHSPYFIEAMAREGIPVTGHVGLIPNWAAWTNFRAVGRSSDEALKVLRGAKDLENAGAATIEIEVVPAQLADYITRSTHMITMGMGCGNACDTQYLFSCDVLGTNTGHYPRHSKKYADFAKLEAELQAKRVEAFRAFADDVASGGFPEARHQIEMDEAAFQAFLNRADKL